MVKVRDSGTRSSQLYNQLLLHHILAMGLWTSYFNSLCLSFPSCHMEMIIVPTLWVMVQNEVLSILPGRYISKD